MNYDYILSAVTLFFLELIITLFFHLFVYLTLPSLFSFFNFQYNFLPGQKNQIILISLSFPFTHTRVLHVLFQSGVICFIFCQSINHPQICQNIEVHQIFCPFYFCLELYPSHTPSVWPAFCCSRAVVLGFSFVLTIFTLLL